MVERVGTVSIQLDANSAELVKGLRKASDSVARAATKMEAELGTSRRAFQSLESQVKRSSESIRTAVGIGIAAALTAATAKAQALASGLATSIAALGKLSAVTGLSTNTVRSLQIGLEKAGIAVAQTNQGLVAFTRRLGEARNDSGELAAALRRINPELLEQLKQTEGVEAALRVYLDVIGSANDEADRAALLQSGFSEALRRAGAALEDGSSSLDRYASQAAAAGQLIDEDVVKATERLNDAITDLSRTFEGKLAARIIQTQQLFVELARIAIDTGTAIAESLGLTNQSRIEELRQSVGGINEELANLYQIQRQLEDQDFGDSQFAGKRRELLEQRINSLLEERRGLLREIDTLQPAAPSATVPTIATPAPIILPSGGAGDRVVVPSSDPARGPGAARPSFQGTIPVPALKPAIQEAEELNDTLARVRDVGVSAVRGLGDAIADFATGTASATDAVLSLGRALVNSTIQRLVADPLVSSVGSLIPGRAAGGPVAARSPYVVGEAGPELFVPGTAGTIVPNGAGGGVQINVTNNASGLADVAVQSRPGPSGQQIVDMMVSGAIGRQRSRGGLQDPSGRMVTR